MCILDAYSPTQGTDFIELRVLTDSSATVSACVSEIDIDGSHSALCSARLVPADVAEKSGTFFWRASLNGLPCGSAFHVEVTQEGFGGRLCVETNTLVPPPGMRLLRFAVLADMHLNHCTEKTKRLREWATMLAENAIDRAVHEDGAEIVFLPGDLVDTTSAEDLQSAKQVIACCDVETVVVTGNHDDPKALHEAFGVPECGYYSFDRSGVHFVMLSSESEFALSPESEQFRWLEVDLEAHRNVDTLVFSHYSFVAHPFYKTSVTLEDNGRQYLVYGKEACELLSRFPRVRAVFAGHNNVPTIVESNGVSHLLCAQLIQGPCGYDIVDVYEGGFVRMIQEINEQYLVKTAKDRAGGLRWSERVRPDNERNVSVTYPVARSPSPAFALAS